MGSEISRVDLIDSIRQDVVVITGELRGSDDLDDKEVTMKIIPKNTGILLLAVWLIVTGALLLLLQRTEVRMKWGT